MNDLLSFLRESLLSNFAFTINLARNRGGATSGFTESSTDSETLFDIAPCEGVDRFVVSVKKLGNTLLFHLDAEIVYQRGVVSGFTPECAISLPLGSITPDAILASQHYGIWWMQPQFAKAFSELNYRIQSLLMRIGEKHYHVMMLCGDNFRCEINNGALTFTSNASGQHTMKGDFMAITVADAPLAAIEENYANARALGGIRVPLRGERTLPEHFKSFGWCTWDAFYKEVTADKIFEKLREFKEKQIPVKWVLIDDGWMQTKERLLCAFEEDREKFPEGLKATIARMKSEFGIEMVGVWHAFAGYWNGVDLESPLYLEQKDNLTLTPCGCAIPSLDKDNGSRFWDSWHSYLKECGVDFLKVDNQSSHTALLHGLLPTAEGCRKAHAIMEASINKHFGGAVINCMGMDMENVLARPTSAVCRSSNDFYPEVERGFVKHLRDNVYNSIWLDKLYYCDYDMWWSEHKDSAVQSGVLRAVSGSPIYVSDEIGRSNRESILRTVADDGAVMLCDNAAYPTDDCIYVDCVKEQKLQKIWNKSCENLVLAAFSVSDGVVTDSVSFASIPAFDSAKTYVAYEYFTKKYTLCTSDTTLNVTLPKDGVAVWSLYPVQGEGDNAFIMQGSIEKYAPIAAEGEKVLLRSMDIV